MATKPTKAKTAKKDEKLDFTSTIAQLLEITAELVRRQEELERKQKLVTEGYEFVANETRNLFGFGAIAQIFDAIFEKLNK